MPPIRVHWESTHVTPILHELGALDAPALFADALLSAVRRTGSAVPRFLSLGIGDGQLELRLAQALIRGGVEQFAFDCVEPNPLLRARLRAATLASGLDDRVFPIDQDFDPWRAGKHRYDAVLADGSLHHTARLEKLLDAVQRALLPGGWFATRARIGRNGHLRWPEALPEVQRFWQELPPSHRWNHQLRRQEQHFTDWDHARIGRDGVRAQDVLPELLRRFTAPLFAAYGNLIDVFTGPAFGPNLAPGNTWDRAFVEAVHERDEQLLQDGTLTPTHMVALWTADGEPVRAHARGLAPERCVRQR
ncbi:MAG: class I SAM-dependent methyltransferase [Planctomycetes bacterium]|nr:class I SAM-dependent methyltransferase [Planctomycetota bacterium]